MISSMLSEAATEGPKFANDGLVGVPDSELAPAGAIAASLAPAKASHQMALLRVIAAAAHNCTFVGRVLIFILPSGRCQRSNYLCSESRSSHIDHY
jgi:hypothetical protein